MHEGLILALVSICVVFAALFLLYLFYGLMGEIFMRGSSKSAPEHPAPVTDDEEGERKAAAIAVALELQNHRTLTIQRGVSDWKSPECSFRKMVDIDKKSSYKGVQNCGGLPSATICLAASSFRTSDVGTSSTSLGLSLDFPDRVAKQQGAEGF